MSVGMALDLRVVWDHVWLIIVSVIPLILLKMLGIYAVARLGRAPHAEALERAVLMANGGEFAFVLYAAAVGVGLLTPEENGIMTAIIIISMVATPLLVILHDRLRPAPAVSTDGVDAAHDLTGDVLVIGFGRVGQVVSQPLLARGFRISIIDNDVEMIEAAAEFGFKVYYGDGARLDILHAAGAADARLVAVCVDNQDGGDPRSSSCSRPSSRSSGSSSAPSTASMRSSSSSSAPSTRCARPSNWRC